MTRVPRSEVRVIIISSTICSKVVADERTAPEQGTHPRLRNLHSTLSIFSPSPGPNFLPAVELRPIRQRKDANRFFRTDPAVIEIPEFGPLILWVPLTEFVSERKE